MTVLENKVNEVRNAITKLVESADNTRKLALITGVDQSVIYKLANGQKSFDNLALKTVEKLYRTAIEFNVRDKANTHKLSESDINAYGNVAEIEEGEEMFTSIEYGQYGWNFEAINKGTVYYNDGSEADVVITYSVNEVKAPKNATYEELWEAYCEDTNGAEQERTFYILKGEEADIFMELQGAKHLADLVEEFQKSYVVDIFTQDENVKIITQEGDMYFEYTLNPRMKKEIGYVVDLIRDRKLSDVFSSEDVTDTEPVTFEYTIKEVRDYLENA